jgi:hypothetical protein
VWFLIFVLAVVVFLKWRQSKSSSSTSDNTTATGLQAGVLTPYPGGYQVTVPTTGGTTSGGTSGGQPGPPTGTTLSAHQRHVAHLAHEQHLSNIGQASAPAARVTSVTYMPEVVPGLTQVAAKTGVARKSIAAANSGVLGAQAAVSGYTGAPTVRATTPLAVPVSAHQAHLAHVAHVAHVATLNRAAARGAKAFNALKANGQVAAPQPLPFNQGRTV